MQDLPKQISLRRGMLLKIARKRMGSSADAEDVVQDVMVSAIQSAHLFREKGGNLDAWLTTILVNRIRTLWRSGCRRLSNSMREAGYMHPDNTDDFDERVAREALRYAETKVASANQRAMLRLLRNGDTSLKDMACQLGVTEGTVKSRGSRMRRALRKTLEEAGFNSLDDFSDGR